MMKFKIEHKKVLEGLQSKLLLRIRYDTEPVSLTNAEVYVLLGWEVEKVSAKKGLFGHDAYEKLVCIKVKMADDTGTNYYSVFTDSLGMVMWRMERDRKLFLQLTSSLSRFGITLPDKPAV